jgi:hypothetical protein
VVTDYVVMFPADNEAEWEAGTEADHQATFDTDHEFAQLLRAPGGAVTGGAGLAHSSEARTINVAGDRALGWQPGARCPAARPDHCAASALTRQSNLDHGHPLLTRPPIGGSRPRGQSSKVMPGALPAV